MKTIFDHVKDDLDVRNRIGYEQWKKELYPDDGRDWLLEAYQEALDLCVYLKGQLISRGNAVIRRNTVSLPQAGPRSAATNTHPKELQSDAVTNGHAKDS